MNSHRKPTKNMLSLMHINLRPENEFIGIPLPWYSHIQLNEKTYFPAINILSDIVAWMTPTKIEEDDEIVLYRKTSRTKLYRSIKQYKKMFGFSTQQIRKSFEILERLNLITQEFITENRNPNVRLIDVVPETIEFITNPLNKNTKLTLSSQEGGYVVSNIPLCCQQHTTTTTTTTTTPVLLKNNNTYERKPRVRRKRTIKTSSGSEKPSIKSSMKSKIRSKASIKVPSKIKPKTSAPSRDRKINDSIIEYWNKQKSLSVHKIDPTVKTYNQLQRMLTLLRTGKLFKLYAHPNTGSFPLEYHDKKWSSQDIVNSIKAYIKKFEPDNEPINKSILTKSLLAFIYNEHGSHGPSSQIVSVNQYDVRPIYDPLKDLNDMELNAFERLGNIFKDILNVDPFKKPHSTKIRQMLTDFKEIVFPQRKGLNFTDETDPEFIVYVTTWENSLESYIKYLSGTGELDGPNSTNKRATINTFLPSTNGYFWRDFLEKYQTYYDINFLTAEKSS